MTNTKANATAKNVFLNWMSEKMIHVNKAADGRQFASISFPCKQSANGFASVGVNMGQLLPATKRDKSVVDGYKSILLGKPDKERTVSICTKAAKGNAQAKYATIKMTNQDIADAIAADRAAYLQAQAAQAPAQEA